MQPLDIVMSLQNSLATMMNNRNLLHYKLVIHILNGPCNVIGKRLYSNSKKSITFLYIGAFKRKCLCLAEEITYIVLIFDISYR